MGQEFHQSGIGRPLHGPCRQANLQGIAMRTGHLRPRCSGLNVDGDLAALVSYAQPGMHSPHHGPGGPLQGGDWSDHHQLDHDQGRQGAQIHAADGRDDLLKGGQHGP